MDTSPLGPNDAFIALVGITGSGKSTFISTLTDLDTGIGHGLSSSTQKTTIYVHIHEDGRRIYLIDTPGFDDSVRGDVEVLREQVYLFAQLYKSGLQLSGIIYLHSIVKNRVSGSSARNFRMLEQLCGKEGLPHVALVSTMWDQIAPHSTQYWEACGREEELVAKEMFWGSMCSDGSKVRRFNGDRTSALAVVDLLVTKSSATSLCKFQIQRELVDESLSLMETSAAREIMTYLNRMRAKAQHGLKETSRTAEPEETQIKEILTGQCVDTENAIRRLQTGKDDFYKEGRNRFSKLVDRAFRDQVTSQNMLREWDLQSERLEASKEADEEVYRRELREYHRDQGINGMDSQALRDFELQYREEQKRNEEKRLALEKAVRSKKRKMLLKQNILPMLQILGGATAIGVSIPFGVLPVTGAGVSMMGAGIAALRFSTKHKRKTKDVETDDK